MRNKSNNKHKMKLPKLPIKLLIAFVLFMLLPSMAAAEFRSVIVPKAVVYDTPSAQGKKVYLLGQGYPVEVIVNLAEWVKVRDQKGGLSWIDAKQLSPNRTLLVVVLADIKPSPDMGVASIGRLEKDVVIDLLEPAKSGWVKVKHRDGLTGFIQTSAVWGF
jgi:SH3-like domain-containing protein